MQPEEEEQILLISSPPKAPRTNTYQLNWTE